jgi:hypothetical protein
VRSDHLADPAPGGGVVAVRYGGGGAHCRGSPGGCCSGFSLRSVTRLHLVL